LLHLVGLVFITLPRTEVLWEIIFLVERIKIPAHLVQTSVKEGAK
jgi:hypothetical protein